MKVSIDLTLNGDFSRKQREEDFHIVFSSLLTNKKIPWSLRELTELHCEEDLERESLIPTGSVKDIRFHNQYVRGFCDGETCDCCGKPLRFNILRKTLCKECEAQMNRECGPKFPWSDCSKEMVPYDQLARYLNIRMGRPVPIWEE